MDRQFMVQLSSLDRGGVNGPLT